MVVALRHDLLAQALQPNIVLIISTVVTESSLASGSASTSALPLTCQRNFSEKEFFHMSSYVQYALSLRYLPNTISFALNCEKSASINFPIRKVNHDLELNFVTEVSACRQG
ncbi:hypothetical protein QCA50_007150 [Cerrena zonata]|uniref:Uncharacterized protein n=1 Tax=Cerrena zonata TaxID=2478898 RepID=A0AAW0GDE2_9APHY